jgi:tetratricopeptide (TPR) repeat protein
MAAARVAAVLVGVLLCSCGPNVRPKLTWPDTPVALRDDADRDQAIDHLWVMPLGAERDRVRTELAAATARRISDAIEDDRQFTAATLLDQLTWMWQQDPTTVGRGLAVHAELLHRLRGMFAKSGALEPAVQTLVLLAEVEPAQRTEHLAELDEVIAFADELAIADNGVNASRSQPIAMLQPTALALPLPWLVDRYVSLLEARQVAVSSLIDKQGASMQLVRAHQDILSTGHRIANVLARAGRVAEIHRHLARLKGLGDDKELTVRAEIVADQGTADSYGELATALRVGEHTADPAAALATDLAGLAKYPTDATLLAGAGSDARALGRVDQAIAFYEASLRGARDVDVSDALRLGKLYGERIDRLASGGRPGAATTAWREVLAFTSKSANRHPHTVWQQAAAIAESALGRGLASQGLIDEARHALTASLERAPSIDAYETLTTIETQLGRFAAAQRWASAGLAMLGEQTSGDRYRRAKLERIGADALRGGGKTRLAAAHYVASVAAWESLGESKDLPRTIVAERLLDEGRASWWLGDQPKAIEQVMAAVDADPETPAISAGAVAFLIEVGRFRDAVDAYHGGLGATGISDFYKVYMSLWIAGEAKRRGEPLDRLAAEYLASRHGDTWYEMLARAATGRLAFDALRAAATTGPRRAEVAFYGVVLGLEPQGATAVGRKALLEQVVAAQLVLDAGYDLARLYLSAP